MSKLIVDTRRRRTAHPTQIQRESHEAKAAPSGADVALNRIRSLPSATALLVALAIGTSSTAALRAACEYRRSLVAQGEAWRLATMHFVHGWLQLALVDLGALLAFGALLELRSRRAWFAALSFTLVATPAVIVILRPDLERYQGSSAIVCAMLAALLVDVALHSRGAARTAALSALALFAVKLALESADALPLNSAATPRNVEVVALAHVVGAASGLFGACAASGRRSRRRT